MELSEIRVTAGRGGAVLAELRADSPWGDRGYWITIGGWGGTEAEARAQIYTALKALDLDIDKIGKGALGAHVTKREDQSSQAPPDTRC